MKYFLLTIFLVPLVVLPIGFPAGTSVKTPRGYRAIEELRSGDQILSYDHNKTCTDIVIKSWTKKTNKIAHIVLSNGEEVLCEPDQEFFILGKQFLLFDKKQWIQADQLTPGTRLICLNNEPCVVDRVYFSEENRDLFDVTVQQKNNFFVGDQEVCAHNFAIAIPIIVGGTTAGSWLAEVALSVITAIIVGKVCDSINEGDFWSFKGNQDAQAPGMPTEKDGFKPPKKGNEGKVRDPQWEWIWMARQKRTHLGSNWTWFQSSWGTALGCTRPQNR